MQVTNENLMKLCEDYIDYSNVTQKGSAQIYDACALYLLGQKVPDSTKKLLINFFNNR
jgi:hypothetical protein